MMIETGTPATTNPRLLARLHAAGAPVLTLSAVPRSFESVYLALTGDEIRET